MNLSNVIDCNGLSTAPTVLRIKQALVGLEGDALPLGVLLDSDSDCERIEESLGAMAGAVHLAVDGA